MMNGRDPRPEPPDIDEQTVYGAPEQVNGLDPEDMNGAPTSLLTAPIPGADPIQQRREFARSLEQHNGTESGAEPTDFELPEVKGRLAPVPFKDIQLGTTAVYLVRDLIPREGLCVVWGPPKCGKSFWVFDLVMNVALGWKYRDRKVKQGAVVYVACEGQQGFRARIEAYRQKHLSEEAVDVPFYLVPAAIDLIGEFKDLVAAIEAELGNTNPAAVVLDTLNRSIQGDENSPEDMTAYIRAAGAIQEAFGCVVIIVHHCGVEGTRPRGHTSLSGACDAQIAVRRDDTGTITATVEWMKDGPEGAQICSRLEPVEVGEDEDKEAITSCIIVPVDKDTTKSPRPVSGQAKIALDLLNRAITDAGEVPPASNHIPGGIHVVPLTLWREYCFEGLIGDRDNRDTIKRAFNRNIKKLQTLGAVGTWQDLVWPAGQAGQGGTT